MVFLDNSLVYPYCRVFLGLKGFEKESSLVLEQFRLNHDNAGNREWMKLHGALPRSYGSLGQRGSERPNRRSPGTRQSPRAAHSPNRAAGAILAPARSLNNPWRSADRAQGGRRHDG